MNQFLIASILSLGIARLVLVLVQDNICEPLRSLVFRFSKPEAEIVGRFDKNPRFNELEHVSATNPVNVWVTETKRAGWWGQVFSCPDCMGPYVATAVLVGYHYLPTATTYVMMVLAASMVTSLIARRY